MAAFTALVSRAAAPAATVRPPLLRACACSGGRGKSGSCGSAACEDKERKNRTGGVLRKAHSVAGVDVSAPDDALEREADAAADRVVGPGSYPSSVSTAFSGSATGEANALVERARSGSGQALEGGVRGRFEQALSARFDRVRIHRDESAHQAATSVEARAYTLGNDIYFANGQYAPDSAPGQRLLAHELTHVAQQSRPGVAQRLARKGNEPATADCDKGHPPGANINPPQHDGSTANVYLIWGTWQAGDSDSGFVERTYRDWIRWRFGLSSGKQFDDIVAYARANAVPGMKPASTTVGCQYAIVLDRLAYSDIRKLSGEPEREKAAADKAKAEKAAGDPSGTEGASGGTQAPKEKVEGDGTGNAKADGDGDKSAGAGTGGGTKPPAEDAKDKKGKGSIGDFGPMDEAAKENKALDDMPTTRIQSDVSALADAALAAKYLLLLEHYTGRSVSAEDNAAAADGLDAKEVAAIEAGKPMRRALTALITQGWREFGAAGGTDLGAYMVLEQRICEQFTRGNPTATHNQLAIGKGVPEKDVLGIVERGTGILLYSDLGIPYGAFGGVGNRDHGFIGARADQQWGFNIANVEDAGLRIFLNSLRETFGDPARMAIGGAQQYFDNIEAVNAKVVSGLGTEVIQKLEDMLPLFIGFLAGHAVSSFLLKVPNPYVAGVGLALKGLLVGAGYVMDIDFGVGAMSRLLRAAALMSTFEKNDKGTLSQLSQSNLAAAAKVIQEMVAEIAVMFAASALGALISRASKGKSRLKIDCTHCDLDGPGAADAKVDPAKADAAKPEAKTDPAKTDPAKAEPAKTEQQKAAEKLADLQNQRSKTETELKDLRSRRESLRKQRNQAVTDKAAAVKEMDAATTGPAKEAARTKAREALARERAADQALESMPGEEGLAKDMKKLDADIGVESIKADPSSRAKLPCFAGGTPVLTPHGSVAIESLTPGQEVLAWDFSAESAVIGRVAQLHRGRSRRWISATGAGGTVRATPGHRFFERGAHEWIDAAGLVPGSRLMTSDDRSERLHDVATIDVGDGDDTTYNVSVDVAANYFVGPGWLVHNEAVDVGLGGSFVIYRATSPKFPGMVYIGQTTELDINGKARGVVMREAEHNFSSGKKAQDPSGLSPAEKEFHEFMSEAKLEPIIKGIATQEQADYLEQQNIDIERADPQAKSMNRRNEITSEAHRQRIENAIKADPAVKAKGYCP